MPTFTVKLQQTNFKQGYFDVDAESEAEVFLKTIIPSRKATRDYLGKGEADEEKA